MLRKAIFAISEKTYLLGIKASLFSHYEIHVNKTEWRLLCLGAS